MYEQEHKHTQKVTIQRVYVWLKMQKSDNFLSMLGKEIPS